MEIREAKVFSYDIPLTRSVPVAGEVLDQRSGCLLRLKSEDGQMGWGEAAPLPGYSHEDLEEVKKELRVLQTQLPMDIDDLYDAAQELLPSTNFSVGAALSDLAEDPVPEGVRVNGLISGSHHLWPDKAHALVKQGYRGIKFKVGAGFPEAEAETLLSIRYSLGDKIRMRLDANRRWQFDEALRFLGIIVDAQPEYIEEPLSDPADLEALSRETTVPIALDESLAGADHFSRLPGFAGALVIKPTMLGSGTRFEYLLGEARKRKIPVTFSTCFESGVGMRAILRLAAQWGGARAMQGLDTVDLFSEELLVPRPCITDGKLYVSAASNVNTALLDVIS